MINRWTFANLNGRGWVEEVFYSKVDAIAEAKKMYTKDDYVVVGQLKQSSFSDEFYVENQEKVEFK